MTCLLTMSKGRLVYLGMEHMSLYTNYVAKEDRHIFELLLVNKNAEHNLISFFHQRVN